MATVTREQLQSIEWVGPLRVLETDRTCVVCRRSKLEGHALDCWLAAALASPPAEDVQFARDVHMLARRIVVRPERAAELAPHLMRLAERRGALAPGVLRDDEWTPASALSKAYPPSGMIEPGDVIEFAHGNDAPMLQRLTHPAAVEDWNGKLRDRVRQVYTPKAQAPPASDPPGPTVINEDDGDVTIDFDFANDRVVSIRLGEESSGLSALVDGESYALCPLDRVPPKVLALLRTEAKAVTLRQSDPPRLVTLVDKHIDGLRRAYSHDGIDVAMREMGKIRIEALEGFRDTLLPASPQAETKRDCTCLGSCRGAEGLSPRYRCVLASPQAETTKGDE